MSAAPPFEAQPEPPAIDPELAERLRKDSEWLRAELADDEQAGKGDPESNTHPYGGGRFVIRDTGIYFLEEDKDGNTVSTWVCGPLHVVAKTRDAASSDWGRLLEWKDDDEQLHRWSMPSALLQGDGLDVRRELAAGGLHISPSGKSRNLLTAYVQTRPVAARARCVKRLGWHGGAYVTPDIVYGDAKGEKPVFQAEVAILPECSCAGSAAGWRDAVAPLAVGNSRLTFAICVALAGPLLELAGEDSGGFHLRGSSSTGKTTALRLAASVYGRPDRFVRSWRATANGLEGVAAIHNDGVLILDELHQIDPKEAGEAAYMLSNGMGKARASRTGTARQPQNWRLLFLSSGEQSLSARLASIGKTATTGQEVRLADIPADAGKGMGIVEELHHFGTSGELVACLASAFSEEYGHVGREWLETLARDRVALLGSLRENIDNAVAELTDGKPLSGQALRVARRFALVAVAGDLATRYGVSGWVEPDAATEAAKSCFSAWLAGFGGGAADQEERALLAQVQAFLEAHGSSRFEPAAGFDLRVPVRDRVGFVRADGTGGQQYLVLPEQFKREVVKGFDPRFAARTLAAHDCLITQADRLTCMERIPALGGSRRVYVLTAKAAGEEV